MLILLKLFKCCFFILILQFACLLFVASGEEQDLYKLLGIQKTATTREIRQAFKKLALVHHPDKNTVRDLFT